jgi:hypothetical protein
MRRTVTLGSLTAGVTRISVIPEHIRKKTL